MALDRIVIGGQPRCGKSTLANETAALDGREARHTDDLIAGSSWSAASQEAARWMSRPGPWIIEGVATVRALRKWLAANQTGAPCDRLIWLRRPYVSLTPGQYTMGLGCETVLREIRPALVARGVTIEER